jgi:hypothetical protein
MFAIVRNNKLSDKFVIPTDSITDLEVFYITQTVHCHESYNVNGACSWFLTLYDLAVL